MENSKDSFYKVVLFFIWPLLSLGLAFKNYRSKGAKNVLWAFIAFYGFAFAIGAESQNSDIVRYVAQLQYLHGIHLSLAEALKYFQQSGEVDVVRTLIAVVLSRFTGSQSILTMIYGIIFGFFFSRNMWFVLTRLEGKLKPIVIILFISFFLIVPPWNLNGFRFWTATHVFLYGALPYLFGGQKSGVFIASLSILFHFSFIVPVSILFVYIIAGNRLILYFSFFILTFFISEINIEAFNKLIENYAPAIVQERTASYRSENKVEKFRENTKTEKVWYAVWYEKALKWVLMGFMALLFFKSRKFFLDNQKWLNLFSFTLFFFGVSNLLNSLPSGGRFISIASLFSLALLLLYLQNREQDEAMRRLVWLTTPGLLLFIVVAIRTGFYSMSVVSILGNPVIAVFMGSDFMSLNDFIKSIL